MRNYLKQQISKTLLIILTCLLRNSIKIILYDEFGYYMKVHYKFDDMYIYR